MKDKNKKLEEQRQAIIKRLKESGIDFSQYNPIQRADLVNAYLIGGRKSLEKSIPWQIKKLLKKK